ncbi:MAG: hypothetical protein JXB34_03405 [Bacteroidales bacterium]|nr:hypothetical protein [Bacteroidales bacterium]
MEPEAAKNLLFFESVNKQLFRVLMPDRNVGCKNRFTEEFVTPDELVQAMSGRNSACITHTGNLTATSIIASKEIKPAIEALFPESRGSFFYADELIDEKGRVICELTEPEMNRVLKQVYAAKTRRVLVFLLNGAQNAVHENMFFNVLKVAGFQTFVTADCFPVPAGKWRAPKNAE